ncbi:lysosome-associated membrane glycoprotein 3 [Electrophorus electricus]|uniref:Lysosome-associated membrane glycoprotein 2-like luminal domain-containing protein n=1 Tax=Electrophorus electricus TaxID=8005 RepID=A0A4W4FJ16_ELEEL|nr:lysosome-associated membrane glycoprotein 3 [Electrophorus electricus]
MTDARHITMQFMILSALLFLGRGMASETLETEHAEADLDHSGNEKGASLNVSKRPSLQPKETAPATGSFVLKNRKGQVCVKANLGVVYIVIEDKKKSFFNMNPKSTMATGYCGDQRAVLSLVFEGGNLEFTFIKEGSVTYVSKMKAVLEPQPPCEKCKSKKYPGIMDHEKLFSATNGKSFMCNSETSLILADSLRIKMVPLQIQAFDLSKGTFGNEVECWADYTKRIVPIVLGAVAVSVILIAVLVYVLLRERRGQNYEQL